MDTKPIKDLIASGKIPEALDFLLKKTYQTVHENIIISIKARYEAIMSKQMKGIISSIDYILEINKVNNDILEFTELLKGVNQNELEQTYIPEIILSFKNNKYLLEYSNENLQLIFKEIWNNIIEERYPYFSVKIISVETQKDVLVELKRMLEENRKIIIEYSNYNPTVENRKKVVETKEHSKILKKLILQFEKYQYSLVRKIQLLKKIEVYIPDEDIAEIFRHLIEITWNGSLHYSSTNGINDFSGKKEVYPISVYKKYDPKINFSIRISKEEMEELKVVLEVNEKCWNSPQIFLYEEFASRLPRHIKNEKVYPKMINEIYRMEQNENFDFVGKEYLFTIGSFEIAIG